MSHRTSLLALLIVAVSSANALAQPAPPVSDAAKAMVGNWEISNSDRDKRCAVTFSVDPAPRGLKLELETACATAFPTLKDAVAWSIDKSDTVRVLDGKGAALFEFSEVEGGLYESDRKGEGLYFLQAVAALKPDARTAEEMFGDWRFLRELGKPLCTVTFAKDKSADNDYKVVVKQGCDASIAGLGLVTWRLDHDQLVIAGRTSVMRFSEADVSTWERIPLTTNPLLLVRPQPAGGPR
jgi:Protease inhibitor Inh